MTYHPHVLAFLIAFAIAASSPLLARWMPVLPGASREPRLEPWPHALRILPSRPPAPLVQAVVAASALLWVVTVSSAYAELYRLPGCGTGETQRLSPWPLMQCLALGLTCAFTLPIGRPSQLTWNANVLSDGGRSVVVDGHHVVRWRCQTLVVQSGHRSLIVRGHPAELRWLKEQLTFKPSAEPPAVVLALRRHGRRI